MDCEATHNMFDEFESEERGRMRERIESYSGPNNISYVKSSIADLTKRLDFTTSGASSTKHA